MGVAQPQQHSGPPCSRLNVTSGPAQGLNVASPKTIKLNRYAISGFAGLFSSFRCGMLVLEVSGKRSSGAYTYRTQFIPRWRRAYRCRRFRCSAARSIRNFASSKTAPGGFFCHGDVSGKIADLLRNADVSYLNLKDENLQPGDSVGNFNLLNDVLRHDPEAFEYVTPGRKDDLESAQACENAYLEQDSAEASPTGSHDEVFPTVASQKRAREGPSDTSPCRKVGKGLFSYGMNPSESFRNATETSLSGEKMREDDIKRSMMRSTEEF